MSRAGSRRPRAAPRPATRSATAARSRAQPSRSAASQACRRRRHRRNGLRPGPGIRSGSIARAGHCRHRRSRSVRPRRPRRAAAPIDGDAALAHPQPQPRTGHLQFELRADVARRPGGVTTSMRSAPGRRRHPRRSCRDARKCGRAHPAGFRFRRRGATRRRPPDGAPRDRRDGCGAAGPRAGTRGSVERPPAFALATSTPPDARSILASRRGLQASSTASSARRRRRRCDCGSHGKPAALPAPCRFPAEGIGGSPQHMAVRVFRRIDAPPGVADQ